MVAAMTTASRAGILSRAPASSANRRGRHAHWQDRHDGGHPGRPRDRPMRRDEGRHAPAAARCGHGSIHPVSRPRWRRQRPRVCPHTPGHRPGVPGLGVSAEHAKASSARARNMATGRRERRDSSRQAPARCLGGARRPAARAARAHDPPAPTRVPRSMRFMISASRG
jgi:hypothetical protein